ncbi:LysR substrate-binding domain-containing protein [Hoeflea poritis]|uniref:LysR substrate-binding domain-containing protein n=1 Tax=Hoeflea poritis TaxID=2993659 RepID=A0ABT4VPC7_9HYPH|nr:LysR substrate-binding domain-containing protein [Hoeflea poritis]MDA4846568.1 LysR substrate-binding domain-containing protein [Hoeflea poritis]
MSYQLPPVAWLRAFEAAARHSSFAAAASELNMTSAAISHQIRSLEKRLGFGLFERLPRGVRLTDMGAAYVPAVRKAFEELSLATMGIFGSLGDKTLRIRVPISYATLVLVPKLPEFRSAYPGIELQLCTTIWGDGLNHESVDIDIRYGDGTWADQPGKGGFAEKISDESSIVVCSPHYADRLGADAGLAELCSGSLIEIMGCEGMWNDLMRQYGLEMLKPKSGVKSDTSLVALEYAAAGLGAVLVLDAFAEPYLESGRLVQPVEARLPNEQAHYVLRRPGSQHAPEVLLFTDWLLESCR